MPSVTFSVSNAAASHQIILELDQGHTHSKTIVARIDGVEYHLDDCRGFPNGLSIHGDGFTMMIAQTTITVIHASHLTFSGVITDHDSRRVVEFIEACQLPAP